MGNFECDIPSKELFCKIMETKFGRLETDIPKDRYSSNDIFMTGYTSTGEYKTYAVELKERWKYSSTAYGTSGSTEGCIIEDGKIRSLEEAAKSGYTKIYAMLFNDGVLAVWDLDRLPKGWKERRDGVKTFKMHTVDEEGGKYRKSKTGLWYKDAVMMLEYDKERDSWRDCKKRYC